ncbi:MBL fold metallo-hydrolase [Anabaena subtropica]|uniref:MBL fold metallo-hydrolase n=1 Tax=Anabaena subtropica FACHB-260 TaxID=2692884 RepID=A0ABR8CK05_9NOST|nr:MBL fold metallo-hydrolase [Anabaena subtropica]MBD2343106.1 MBL fold metallo-hydrolase [Anabaena subtropica FACHB-260]
MYLTWLDNNSWLLELNNQRILIDPWLVDVLTFGNLDWLFKASHRQDCQIPENIDLILLSQGLEDHAHPPTLKRLDHKIPVVASPNGAKVAQGLGYASVTTLNHGENFILNNQIEIRAFPGSSIGPTLIENSYLLKDLATGFTLYYEPHGEHSPQLKQFAPVDVVITPIVDATLPLIGRIIKGNKSALEVAQWLRPQAMLPTANAKETTYEGILTKLLKIEGSIADFRLLLEKHNLSIQVLEPNPGDRLELQKKFTSPKSPSF